MIDNGVFERVMEIINYIIDMECVTVQEISEYMNIPENIVCDDLRNIIKAEELGITVFAYNDKDDTDDFQEELLEGKHNDIQICAGLDTENWNCTLTLNSFEKVLLNEVLSDNRNTLTENFVIKKLVRNNDENSYIKIKTICDAIEKESELYINYYGKNNTISVCVYPLRIIKLVDSELFYMAAICDNKICIYRIDRIKKIEKRSEGDKKINIPEECLEILKNFEYSWGTNILGEKINVKLRVAKEANVYNKVYHELRNRKFAKWTDAGEYYIYEDIIIGDTEFMAWVRKYGYSVIVLEPRWMAEKILDSAIKKYEIYSDNII